MTTLIAALLLAAALGVGWYAYRQWRQEQERKERIQAIAEERLQTSGLDGDDEDVDLRRASQEATGAVFERLARLFPRMDDVHVLLAQARIGWNANTFLALSVVLAGLGGVLGLWIMGNTLAMVIGGLVCGSLPTLYLRRKRSQRWDEFEEQLPEAIDLLVRSLRAGHALSSGIGVVAEEMPAPAGEEFRQLYEEQKYGMPLRRSLERMLERMPGPDMEMLATSIMIQKESGGNLTDILDNLANIIRDRFEFRRELKTKTAQPRMTGYFLMAAPVLAGAGMYLFNPAYMRPLFTETLGHYMLAGTGLLQLIGFLVIRKITDIEL